MNPALTRQSPPDPVRIDAQRSLGRLPLHQIRRTSNRCWASAETRKLERQASEATESRWLSGEASGFNSCEKEAGMPFVNSHFDSGNIEVVDASSPDNIQLRIHADPYCDGDKCAHFQWFHFRVTGCRDVPLNLRIMNAGEASFPEAWQNYRGCASYNRRTWFRVDTQYEGGVLSFKHKPDKDAVYYAFFAPYSYKRHQDLVADTLSSEHVPVRLHMLGETLDGHDLDMLQIGEPKEGSKRVWIIARQHPGESMAEWFMEGLYKRLLDNYDSVSRKLLNDAVFYTVPNMNPDGTWRGHLRTNAAGANLNREWGKPSLESSPEVFYTLKAMEELGCDLMLDIHGDEAIEANFLNGNQGIPSWDDRLASLEKQFIDAFLRASPDFQAELGYDLDKPGQANLDICSHAVGEKFKALSFTLEMPFKDTSATPDPKQGWSVERSKRFGADILHPILEVLPNLR